MGSSNGFERRCGVRRRRIDRSGTRSLDRERDARDGEGDRHEGGQDAVHVNEVSRAIEAVKPHGRLAPTRATDR
jgi:hypothetical protein